MRGREHHARVFLIKKVGIEGREHGEASNSELRKKSKKKNKGPG